MTTWTTYNGIEAITWRQVNGIWRGVQVETDMTAVARSRKLDPSEEIVCIVCDAHADEPCRMSTGRTLSAARSHPERTRPRVCPCGRALKPGCTYCDGCAIKRRRQVTRDWNRRTRAGLREAS